MIALLVRFVVFLLQVALVAWLVFVGLFWLLGRLFPEDDDDEPTGPAS